MWGCWRRAASRISRWKRSGPSDCGQLGVEHLEGDRAVVLEVAGEEDRGHAAAAELAEESVLASESGFELRAQVGHGGPGCGVGRATVENTHVCCGVPGAGARGSSLRAPQ